MNNLCQSKLFLSSSYFNSINVVKEGWWILFLSLELDYVWWIMNTLCSSLIVITEIFDIRVIMLGRVSPGHTGVTLRPVLSSYTVKHLTPGISQNTNGGFFTSVILLTVNLSYCLCDGQDHKRGDMAWLSKNTTRKCPHYTLMVSSSAISKDLHIWYLQDFLSTVIKLWEIMRGPVSSC